MHRLAACSLAESQCLYDVQRFMYKRLVQGFVRVDAETLELQATGVCRTVNANNFTSIDIFDNRWQSNLLTGEVRPPPYSTRLCAAFRMYVSTISEVFGACSVYILARKAG